MSNMLVFINIVLKKLPATNSRIKSYKKILNFKNCHTLIRNKKYSFTKLHKTQMKTRGEIAKQTFVILEIFF